MTRPSALLTAALALACSGPRPAPGADGSAEPPALRLPGGVRPVAYALEIAADPDELGHRGHVAIEVELARPTSRWWMHGRGLEVSGARVHTPAGELPATYRQVTPEGVVQLETVRPVPAGRATLHLDFAAPWNERLAGFFRVEQGGRRYVATQLEAVDARRVFPCFDEPGFKTPFQVALTVPRGLTAVSNGPVIAEEPAGEGRVRVRFAETPPLPTYLLFLAAGPFDVVERVVPAHALRDRPLPLRGLAPAGEGARLGFALDAAAALVPWMERWFGLAFPYPKLDQLALPGAHGAMENAGAILYASPLLLDDAAIHPESHRDEVALVVAHEVAHQWFGDLVTLPWWDDVWLNEAFASFLESKAVEAWRPESRAQLRGIVGEAYAASQDGLQSARAVRQPLLQVGEVWGQFDGMSYEKGAALLRMVERWSGPGRFQEGIRAFVRDHAHGTGTTAELLQALSRASGRDLAALLPGYLDRPGIPSLEARLACDAAGARLEVIQSRWLPTGSTAGRNLQWQVPLCVRYELSGTTGEACALLEGPRGTVPLPGCPAWVLPDAGGAGYWVWSLPPDELRALRQHGLSRLEPAERLSLARSAWASARSGDLPAAEALAVLAQLSQDEVEVVAAAPMSPLRQAIEQLVPEASRPTARAFAAARYRPRLAELGYAPAPGETAARRSLREQLLGFLVQVARDPGTVRAAAARGRAWIAGGRAEDGAPGPDLLGPCLAAVLAADGAPALAALEARLAATDDAALRSTIVEAMASATDPELSAPVLALAGDPRLTSGERLDLIHGQGSRPETGAAAFAWVQGHFDALVASLSELQASGLPLVTAAFCSRERAAEARAFFGPRLDRLPGAQRKLDQALEAVELCAALRAEQGASAEGFLAPR